MSQFINIKLIVIYQLIHKIYYLDFFYDKGINANNIIIPPKRTTLGSHIQNLQTRKSVSCFLDVDYDKRLGMESRIFKNVRKYNVDWKRKMGPMTIYPTSCAVQGQNTNIFSMVHALGSADTPRHSIITEISKQRTQQWEKKETQCPCEPKRGRQRARKGEKRREHGWSEKRREHGWSEKARGRGETIPRNFYYVILAI